MRQRLWHTERPLPGRFPKRVLLDFEQYENDPYIRALMGGNLPPWTICTAINGVGPDTEISGIVFWPVKLMFVLTLVF